MRGARHFFVSSFGTEPCKPAFDRSVFETKLTAYVDCVLDFFGTSCQTLERNFRLQIGRSINAKEYPIPVCLAAAVLALELNLQRCDFRCSKTGFDQAANRPHRVFLSHGNPIALCLSKGIVVFLSYVV